MCSTDLPKRDIDPQHKAERATLDAAQRTMWRSDYNYHKDAWNEVTIVPAVFDISKHTIDIKNLGW